MDNFRSIVCDSASAAVSSIPDRVNYIMEFAGKEVSQTLSTVEQEFLVIANDAVAKHSVPVNDKLTNLVSKTKEIVADAIVTLATMSRWINVNIPRIEDGGNFGVAVQECVLKAISDLSKDLSTKLDGLNEYHSKRAEAVKAVAGDFSTSNSTSSSKKLEGEENKDSSSTEKKSTMTYKSYHKDSIRAIAAVDAKFYFQVQVALQAAADAYLAAGCAAERNKERLENPRGTTKTKNPLNMY
eukprot:GDKJ01048189.1.p1 GENE.GDKJ01048189.1~~GDKJ01048189.1.p1  ORF type:complete len:241 (-),score=74.82 GDKJ01048189.1:85-807(-)